MNQLVRGPFYGFQVSASLMAAKVSSPLAGSQFDRRGNFKKANIEVF